MMLFDYIEKALKWCTTDSKPKRRSKKKKIRSKQTKRKIRKKIPKPKKIKRKLKTKKSKKLNRISKPHIIVKMDKETENKFKAIERKLVTSFQILKDENKNRDNKLGRIEQKQIEILEKLEIPPKMTHDTRHVTDDVTRDTSRMTRNLDLKPKEILLNLKENAKLVLATLYHSNKPMDYQEMAKEIKRSYGTVKNIMSDIRKKGIKVEEFVDGQGNKSFSLSKEVKLEISGR